MLWIELKDIYTFLEGVDQELVKKCALKNMALAFASFKEKFYPNTSLVLSLESRSQWRAEGDLLSWLETPTRTK